MLLGSYEIPAMQSNLKFPQPGSTPENVCISSLRMQDWTGMSEAQNPSWFPIVIRLEALTDEGRAAGRSLDSEAVGRELPTWIQSQTTYARMQRTEEGIWTPHHVIQKLWYQGKIYECQEIYGMEQGRPAETVDGVDDIEGSECVICMSEPRDTTALPCRHMCLCNSCADALKAQTNKCPICRMKVENFLTIKIGQAADRR
jgi:E3 ubiquitin-protein ligase MGRN1